MHGFKEDAGAGPLGSETRGGYSTISSEEDPVLRNMSLVAAKSKLGVKVGISPLGAPMPIMPCGGAS